MNQVRTQEPNSSQQAVRFAELANATSLRLLAGADERGHHLAGQLVAIASEIERWKDKPPIDYQRQIRTRKFVELMTTAQRFLAP